MSRRTDIFISEAICPSCHSSAFDLAMNAQVCTKCGWDNFQEATTWQLSQCPKEGQLDFIDKSRKIEACEIEGDLAWAARIIKAAYILRIGEENNGTTHPEDSGQG